MENKDFETYIQRTKVLSKWYQFLKDRTTELWDKEDFLFLLNNEDIILNYCFVEFDGKYRVEKENKEIFKPKIERLREIYNERFKEIEDTESTTQYTNPQLYYLLKQIGVFDLPFYKSIKLEGDKEKLIAKILKSIDKTAQKVKNESDRYTPSNEQKEKVDKFLASLNKDK
jgi:hypothetical protein